VIPRYFVVAERDHELQNPTSREKLLDLGRRLGLAPDVRLLDVASGRGGPAVLLASEFGCTVHGIEISPDFHAVALERAAAQGVLDRVSFDRVNAEHATFEPGAYDVAMCLGASFIWGGLAGTLDVLEPAARAGGFVVVGEPFWRHMPLPDDYAERDEPFTTLEGTVAIFESGELVTTSLIVSSDDDWDRYETLHWHAVVTWLEENRTDSDAADIGARHELAKHNYLRHGRDALGWAIFVGRKRS
jgi:hypothetical protein